MQENIHSKVQDFKRQIRRDYINEYFKKKRKQFVNSSQIISQSNQNKQIVNNQLHKIIQSMDVSNHLSEKSQNINKNDVKTFTLEELSQIAKLTSTEYGVQVLLKTQIPKNLLSYLFPKYYNTIEQYYVTCLYANITYLPPQKVPNHQFLKSISNILSNTLNCEIIQEQNNELNFPQNNNLNIQIQTQQNCLLIIYNLIVQFDEVLEYYLDQKNDCELMNLLYGILDTQAIQDIVQKVFKILHSIQKNYIQGIEMANAHKKMKQSQKKMLKRFLKSYISIFQNVQQTNLIFLSLSNIKQLLYINSKQPYLRSKNIQQNFYEQPTMFTQYEPSQLFNEEDLPLLQKQVENSKILNKIQAIYPLFKNNKLILDQILLLFYNLISGLKRQTIKQKVIKTLYKIYMDHFHYPTQLNNNDIQIEHSMQKFNLLKQRFYQVIYHILISFNIDHDLFTKSQLYPKMLLNLQHLLDYQTDKQTQKAYIYIFGMLTFSGEIQSESQNKLLEFIEKVQLQEYFQFDNKFMDFVQNVRDFNQSFEQQQTYSQVI